MATPTQPYTQVKSEPTSASDEPPTTSCATIQAQAMRPTTLSKRTTGYGTSRMGLTDVGFQRPVWEYATANETPTAVSAAPARYVDE